MVGGNFGLCPNEIFGRPCCAPPPGVVVAPVWTPPPVFFLAKRGGYNRGWGMAGQFQIKKNKHNIFWCPINIADFDLNLVAAASCLQNGRWSWMSRNKPQAGGCHNGEGIWPNATKCRWTKGFFHRNAPVAFLVSWPQCTPEWPHLAAALGRTKPAEKD